MKVVLHANLGQSPRCKKKTGYGERDSTDRGDLGGPTRDRPAVKELASDERHGNLHEPFFSAKGRRQPSGRAQPGAAMDHSSLPPGTTTSSSMAVCAAGPTVCNAGARLNAPAVATHAGRPLWAAQRCIPGLSSPIQAGADLGSRPSRTQLTRPASSTIARHRLRFPESAPRSGRAPFGTLGRPRHRSSRAAGLPGSAGRGDRAGRQT